MSVCFKRIFLELSYAAYVLSFCVKDEFGKYIYQSSTLIALSQYVFSGGTSISNYEESILNLQCPSQRKADPCERTQSTGSPNTILLRVKHLMDICVCEKKLSLVLIPLPLLHVDSVSIIKATNPCSATLKVVVLS